MDRAYASGASATPPTPPASPSTGYPTAGNPAMAVPPTKPGKYWYFMITEELRNVVSAAGLSPLQSDVTQILQALPAALASRPEMARNLSVNGYQKLPGGLILQWGRASTSAAGTAAITFPIAFPTACLNTYATISAAAVAGSNTMSIDRSSLTPVGATAWVGTASVRDFSFFAIGY